MGYPLVFEDAAPCKHCGAPSDDLVDSVVKLLTVYLSVDAQYLNSKGLSPDEFRRAFPAAVEKIRGSWAASTTSRRDFAQRVIRHLAERKAIYSYDLPKYGDDTIYRIRLHDGTHVGVIQKGCPDGAHSSTRWTRPEWADELYLWWLCSSQNMEPGEHIWKGVSRVRKKIMSEDTNQLDGVIFYNDLCGTSERPCPKKQRVVSLDGLRLPPPCIYVTPHWTSEPELNWRGGVTRKFPGVLLSAFDLKADELGDYIGYIGFKHFGKVVKTEVTTRFGPAKAKSVRG